MLIKDSDSAWLFIKKSAKNLYGHCHLGRTTSYGPDITWQKQTFLFFAEVVKTLNT